METEKEETTLDLNQIMEEGMDEFQGELNEAAREDADDKGPAALDGGRTETDESITPKPADDASPPKETEDGESATDDGSAATEDPESSAAGTDEKDTSKEEKSFRFKSHEEAENGYRHLQSAKTRAEAEAERLRVELQKATDAERTKKELAEKDEDLLEFMADEHEKALDAIDGLDPDDEGYRKDVARIWAEKDSAVEVRKRDLYQTEEAETPAPAAETDASDESKGWDVVESRARDEEIDPEDQHFLDSCTLAPRKGADGNELSFEEQIDWAVHRTKDYHTKQERQFRERQKKAAKKKSDAHQEENLPLGRSPADRRAEVPDKVPVVTLNDAVEGVLEERRL
jgi:hypothetical protein